MMMGITFQEFQHVHRAQAGMSECKGVHAAGDLPVAELTALEKEFEGDGLSRFYYGSCGLLCKARFIVSFVWAEHWQIVI